MENDTLIELSERELGERVARLETERAMDRETLKDIKTKLDSLLDLKSKGMGAFWFFGLIFSSGMLGLVAAVINAINNHRPHL